jgi:hypothetical protein
VVVPTGGSAGVPLPLPKHATSPAGPLVRNFGGVELCERGFGSAVRFSSEATSGPDGVPFERHGFPADEVLLLAKSQARNATPPIARKLTAIAT